MRAITWKCDICGFNRPDAKISVFKRPLIVNGNRLGDQNIKYCNDKPGCTEESKTFSLVKNS